MIFPKFYEYWKYISDIPSVPVPDVQNNLDKDEIEEPIVMESAENPSYQQLASLRSKFFYDRPGRI